MEQIIEFKCQKCGKCCRKTLQTIKLPNGETIITGPQIQLTEVPLFEAQALAPQLAGGKKRRILTYQIATDGCPHLKGNDCSIYEKRPLVCRAYPVQDCLVPDARCTFVESHALFVGNDRFTFTSPIDFKGCMDAHRDIYGVYRSLKWFKPPFWIFDLKTKTWHYLSISDMEKVVEMNT